MSGDELFLGIDKGLLVQGLVGLLIAAWVFKDAIGTYRATRKQLQPNPVVAGVSMAWDRDQQERFLQLVERLAKAAEEQAGLQKQMAVSWTAMSDRQRESMDQKIERLLKALDQAEHKDLSAMVAAVTGHNR